MRTSEIRRGLPLSRPCNVIGPKQNNRSQRTANKPSPVKLDDHACATYSSAIQIAASPSEPLVPFGPDLWISDGPAMTGAAGFQFPTRMCVIRLPDDDGLWIWSPFALTDTLRAAVDTRGAVRHLIAPNSLHVTFLAAWAKAYPGATVHAAPGLSETATRTPIHAILRDTPDAGWIGTIDQVVVHGNRITTEVVFFHHASATVLVTDLVQHIPQGWYHGWRAVVANLDLMTAALPSVPRKFRLATTGRSDARRAVKRILAWPAKRLVMAHGTPLSSGGSEALQQAFHWLTRADKC